MGIRAVDIVDLHNVLLHLGLSDAEIQRQVMRSRARVAKQELAQWEREQRKAKRKRVLP